MLPQRRTSPLRCPALPSILSFRVYLYRIVSLSLAVHPPRWISFRRAMPCTMACAVPRGAGPALNFNIREMRDLPAFCPSSVVCAAAAPLRQLAVGLRRCSHMCD